MRRRNILRKITRLAKDFAHNVDFCKCKLADCEHPRQLRLAITKSLHTIQVSTKRIENDLPHYVGAQCGR